MVSRVGRANKKTAVDIRVTEHVRSNFALPNAPFVASDLSQVIEIDASGHWSLLMDQGGSNHARKEFRETAEAG